MTRRRFSKESKADAVRLVVEQQLSTQQAAEDLGIGQTTLENWVRKHREEHQGEDLTETERAELKRLRKEVNTLRMERDILEKATALFAKPGM